jgi:hypothetical protein
MRRLAAACAGFAVASGIAAAVGAARLFFGRVERSGAGDA